MKLKQLLVLLSLTLSAALLSGCDKPVHEVGAPTVPPILLQPQETPPAPIHLIASVPPCRA